MTSTPDQQLSVSYSEDDGDGPSEPGISKQASIKRGTRGTCPACLCRRHVAQGRPACDRCRKIKSKCEPGSGTSDRCKNCEVANTRTYAYSANLIHRLTVRPPLACTFQGVFVLSYMRRRSPLNVPQARVLSVDRLKATFTPSSSDGIKSNAS